MEKGAGVKLVDVGVALSTVQVVQVQPYGHGGQTQPHKVDEQLRIIGILQQFAQFRADAEVRMQKMEAQFKQAVGVASGGGRCERGARGKRYKRCMKTTTTNMIQVQKSPQP